VRARVHRPRQPAEDAGGDPPGAVRIGGAVPGDSAGALRRSLADLAGAGAGGGAADRRGAGRARARGARAVRGGGGAGGADGGGEQDRLPHPGGGAAQDSLHAGDREAGGGERRGLSADVPREGPRDHGAGGGAGRDHREDAGAEAGRDGEGLQRPVPHRRGGRRGDGVLAQPVGDGGGDGGIGFGGEGHRVLGGEAFRRGLVEVLEAGEAGDFGAGLGALEQVGVFGADREVAAALDKEHGL